MIDWVRYDKKTVAAQYDEERIFVTNQLCRVEQVYKQYGRGLANIENRKTELFYIKQASKDWYKGKT